MKAKVNLGLSRMSVPMKIEKARHIVTAMTGNANFTTPAPALVNITTAANTLEGAYNAAQGAGPAQTAIMYDKETLLDNLLTQLANYVESIANGVESIILSAGINVKGKGGGNPHVFEVLAGTAEGEVILHSDVVKRASYIWQMSGDPLPAEPPAQPNTSNWKQAGVSTKATFTLTGLQPGQRYWFRVAIVTNAGQDAWSDPVSIIVQ